MKKTVLKVIAKYLILLALMIIISIALGRAARKQNLKIYNEAKSFFDDGNYKAAYELFEELDDFDDSKEMANKANEMYCLELASNNFIIRKYDVAVEELNKISSNDNNIIAKKNDLLYQIGVSYFDDGMFDESKDVFEEIEEYKDSNIYLAQIELRTIDDKKRELYSSAIIDFNNGDYQIALSKFQDIVGYEDSDEYILKCEDLIKRTDINKTIAAGIINTVAITEDGNLLYTNYDNPEFSKTSDWENLISVDAYGEIIIAIDKDCNLYTAGKYDNGSELRFERNTDCIDVATGEQFAIALFSDGKVEANGHNDDGQCNVEDWNNYEVIDVDAGWRFSVGLTNEGELLFAGICQNQRNQYLAEKNLWKDVVSISSSGGGESAVGSSMHGKGHTVGLRKDGTVVAIGDNSYGQCDVDSWSDIVRVATGDWYTIGVKSDGSVLITGENQPRMRYIDSTMFDNDYVDVAAGYGQTILITSDGGINAYGFNDYKKQEIADSWNNIKKNDIK